jgi:hypothetical protein
MPDTEVAQKELRKMLRELLNLAHGLNERTIKFLDDLHGWIGDFSPAQASKLEDIYYEHF